MKERRNKMDLDYLENEILLCPKQVVLAFQILLSARFILERMHFSKYSAVTCSPTCFHCLMLIPFQHWYSLDCYLVQVLLKYKFLLAKLSEHFPEQTQIKYLILTKSVFLSSTQTWKTGCLLLLRVPDNPSPPQHISFNFNQFLILSVT